MHLITPCTSCTDLKVMLSFFEILLVLLSQLTIQAASDSRNLTFLSYFPCTDLPDGNATHFVEKCDLLTYVAATLAVEEINSNQDVLSGSFVNLVSFATRKVSLSFFSRREGFTPGLPSSCMSGIY